MLFLAERAGREREEGQSLEREGREEALQASEQAAVDGWMEVLPLPAASLPSRLELPRSGVGVGGREEGLRGI